MTGLATWVPADADAPAVRIAVESPLQDDIRALIGELNVVLHELTPPEFCYNLKPEEMAQPNVTVFVARSDGRAVAIGALRRHEGGVGEVKRMYTRPEMQGRGLGGAILAAIEAMAVGDGLEAGSQLGPLINDDAVSKVEEHIADAVAKGGKVLTGGARHALGGTFFQPTIVTGATREMTVSGEETFGPLAPLFKFETDDEVIELANDTIFGLAAYFFARDLSRVTKVQEALEYGMVGVNTGLISTEVAPFGGVKQSGLGREGSRHGMAEFMEMKYICTSVNTD